MARSPYPLHLDSPHSSPSQSVHGGDQHPTSVETLVSYLVAAKRSLGSIRLVHRATQILSDARASIESTTVLLAKTSYLRRSLASQLKILRGVQFELETSAQEIQIDFQHVIKELDDTGERLVQYINFLKQTDIEDAFKASADPEDVAGKDTLHDFVDDKALETIKAAMQTTIDIVQNAQHEMSQSIQTLEEDLQSVNEVLVNSIQASATESELEQPSMAKTLIIMEDHAREMAQGLEALVKHFDLCVTAIKHTEGGGEAVVKTMDGEDLPEAVGMEMHELRAPSQPMNEAERIEMLEVLENDAAEVDEVVMEIQDRNADMEAQLERIVRWRERRDAEYSDILTAFKLLEKIGSRLPGYVAETVQHTNAWQEEKAKIEDGISGMEELCEHYINFLHAYDGLIVEVARRRTVKKQMERIVNEAHAQLEQLYEQDHAQRLDFKSDQGAFLPIDIWHGVNTLPPRYAITRFDEEGVAASIPDLPRKTVEDALKRLKAGGRTTR